MGREECQKRVDRFSLGNPQLPEIDGWVTRLPTLEKPLDRRMKRDRSEFSDTKCPMAANGSVLRADILERPGDIRREDHVHDVLAFRPLLGGDRIDERDGTFERYFDALGKKPGFLPQLSAQGSNETLARSDSPSGE